MFRVALVNPPFAMHNAPALALGQLRSVLEHGPHRDRLRVSEHYANMDVARFLGLQLYDYVANSVDMLNCGLGEWLFRQAAFPAIADNSEQYLARHRHVVAQANLQKYVAHLVQKRAELPRVIERIVDRYQLDRVDLVGITSMFAQTMAATAIARAIKRRNPRVTVVLGGANCEAPMGEQLANHLEVFDYVFSGPSLVSFPAFVECVLEATPEKIREIDGVIPNPRAQQTERPARTVGRDLSMDHVVPVDYAPFLSSLRAAFEPHEVAPMLFFETSRGCWWGEKAHCTFCGLNGSTMNYRNMEPADAIAQFEQLFAFAPLVEELQAVDNILPRRYIKEVLPFIKAPDAMHIFYEVKADLVEEEFAVLARAGVRRVQPGIEALATSTLKLMRKGTSAPQNIEFLKNCVKYGIHPAWNLLIGFPGESEDVYRKYARDLPSLVHLPPPTGAFPVRFDRYSPYFVRASEYGLALEPVDFYELVYPFPKPVLRDLAYFFTDTNGDAPYMAATARWRQPLRQVVSEWRRHWQSDTTEGPVLQFEADASTIVRDTRFQGTRRHDVGAIGRAVLDYLSKPRRLADVPQAMAAHPRADVEQAVVQARQKALLFEEGERAISLVMSGPTARPREQAASAAASVEH